MLFITYQALKDIDNLSDNTITKDEVIKKTTEFLLDEFEVDGSKIKPEADIRNTLNLDSLDYVDLVVLVERNFNFTPKEKDFLSLKTFNDFYEYCYNKIQNK